MGKQRTPQQLAKTLSYILGYRPDEFGLVLDDSGFVRTKELLKAVSEEEGWGYVRRSHIDEILYTLPDPPIEIDGQLIRAKERGRLPVATPAETPPKLLYTGVRRRAYPSVHRKGVFPGAIPHVVLSSDRAVAERIGRRLDGTPVLLTVRVSDAVAGGVRFTQKGDCIYLAGFLPPGCFSGPPLPKEKPEEARPGDRQERPPAPRPGSFHVSLEEDKGTRERAKRKRKKDSSRKRDRDRKRRQREKMW